MKKLSVVIPVYNEEARLAQNIRCIEEHIRRVGDNYQIVLVDDGSVDATWDVVLSLHRQSAQIEGVQFSRNFGKDRALSAGLREADGDYVLVMDADLEHPPEIIPQMYAILEEEGVDMVEAVKSSRGKESLFYRGFAATFYKIFTRLSGFDLQRASDYKMFCRRAAEAINECTEYSFFFRGVSSWIGFSRKQIDFDVGLREGDETKWTLLGLCRLGLNAITSFTSAPLHLVTFFAIVFGLFSVALGAQTLYNYMVGESISGFTTVILLILILGCFLMAGLGIIGEYVARIYDETRMRPRYIVRERLK